MERKEYQKGLKYHYLVLSSGKEVWQENYELPMLVHNHIHGLLRCEVIRMDGNLELHYEITNSCIMEKVYEKDKMDYDQLRRFLLDLLSVLEQLAEYMLNEDHLILEPSYIYINQNSGQVQFCYLPFYQGAFRENFHSLVEYFMKIINYQQRECVTLGTKLHKKSMEAYCDVSEVLSEVFIAERSEEENGYDYETPAVPADYESEEVSIDSVEEIKRSKVRQIIGGAGCVIIVAEVLGIIYLKFFHEHNFSDSDLLKAVIAIIVTIAVVLYILLKQEEVKKEFEWEVEEEETDPRIGGQEMEEEYTVLLRVEQPEGGCLKYVGEESFADFYITRDTYLVGKKKEIADGVIDDLSVSRVHSKIIKEGEDYYIIDLGSTNGTFLNGEKIVPNEKVKLNKNDSVHFSKVEYIWDKITG